MTTVDTLAVSVEDKGGLKREISFQIPADVVSGALGAAYDRVARSTKMKGFRNGKVPRSVVKARFGKEVHGDVLNQMVPDYYRQAIAQESLDPLTEPSFGELDLNDGSPLDVTCSFEVRPELILASYEGLPLTGQDPAATEDDVKVAHQSLLESMASLEACDNDHVAADGDVAVIDFDGTIDGEPFDGGNAQNYALTLGDGRFIPGFEEQVVGHKAGDAFDVNVAFPEDYHAEDLAGKAVVFAIKLNEIKTKVMPELDDDFAGQVGEFENLEALNRTLGEQIESKRVEDQRRSHRHEVFNQLANANDFDVPEVWIDEEVENLLDTRRRLAQSQGMEVPEVDDEKRVEMRGDAEIQARGRLVVMEIAKTEGIEVTEAEYTQEIQRLAQEYQRPVDEIVQLIQSNPAETARLSDFLLKTKVLDLVVDKAEVTLVPRTSDTSDTSDTSED